jgi:DNA sulfur modification protein DndD
MIFESLTLHNYGLYRGEHRIDLWKDEEGRNITLLGGLNGAGKTTFLEALQLALYGRLAPVVQGSTQTYDAILLGRINRQVNQLDGASLELVFRVQEEGQPRRYAVRRCWTGKNGKAKESLEVYVDGRFDEILTDTWTEHAERFIPARLAPLFFFDGEKIEALADPERSTQAIRTAMEALLGLDIVTQLEADLTTLERRKIKSTGPSNKEDAEVDQKIKELETAYAERRKDVEKSKQIVASMRNDVDRVQKELDKVQRELAAKGGDAYEGRREIEARFEEAKEALKENEDKLREVACGSLPLFLLIGKLKEIHAESQQALEAHRLGMLETFIAAHNERLLEFLDAEPSASGDLRTRVREFLDREYTSMFGARGDYSSTSPIDDAVVDRIIYLISHLPEVERDACKMLNEHERLVQKTHTLERSLATIPDKDTIAELFAEREKLRNILMELKIRVKLLDEEVQRYAAQAEVIKEQLAKEMLKRADAIQESSKEARIIDHTRRALKTLAVFKQRLLEKHAGRLAQLVQDSFSHLIRKEALTSEIRINPVDCSLCLYDSDGEKLPPDRLSAGERQLLAVSLLWGLARAAGRPLPIVVDTPLGRLDGTHRINLVSRYFPHASHQVIVLSTDEEIDAALLEHLKPYIAHSYLLEYRDDLKHSVVRPGYFAEAEAML